MNEELVNALKVVLADHYAVYFKAQGYHWNVEGADFSEYHGLFSSIYEDAIGAVDMIAEDIRKCQAYAPFKMSRFAELATVQETEVASDCHSMSADLLVAVEAAIASNAIAYVIANNMNASGVANDLAGRDGCLQKWAWQLRSSLK
jgi:starvation-inducible DNA-binding protein